MQKSTTAMAMVALGAIMYGFLGYFSNIFSENGYTSLEIAFIRDAIPIVPLIIVILAIDPVSFKIRPRDIWVFIAVGALKSVADILFFESMKMMPISVATVMQMTASVIVVVLSFFILKKPITKKKIVSIALCLLGACLVTGVFSSSGRVEPMGILIAAMGASLIALFIMSGEIATKRGYQAHTTLLYTMIFGSLILAPFSNFGRIIGGFGDPTVYNSMIIIAIGLTLLPLAMMMMAFKALDSSIISILCVIEVPSSALVGFFLMEQDLDAFCILGMVMITASVILLRVDIPKLLRRFSKGKDDAAEELPPVDAKSLTGDTKVVLNGVRLDHLFSFMAVLLLITSLVTLYSSYRIESFGTTVSCVCVIGMIAGAAIFFYLSAKIRSGEMTASESFCRAIRCIGGIMLFMGLFAIPYNSLHSAMAIFLGLFFIHCGYRSGKGGSFERRFTTVFLILLLMCQAANGFFEMTDDFYRAIGVCNLIIALLFALFLRDKRIIGTMYRGASP